MKLIILLIILFFWSCQEKVSFIESEKDKSIDRVLIYCSAFYKAIDHVSLKYSQQKTFSESLQNILEKKLPYCIISDRDSLVILKEIFFNDFILIDSNENNRKKIGDYFLLIESVNGNSTLTYISDSIWVYNQKYLIKYKKNLMYDILKFQNINIIDCFSTDSVKVTRDTTSKKTLEKEVPRAGASMI